MEGLLILAGLVVGLAVGYFIARSINPKRGRVKELEVALAQEKESLNNYRNKVSQHFSHTAELVEALAANSREIYSHLAQGSQELCGSDVASLNESDDVLSISGADKVKAQSEEVAPPQLETESTGSVPEKDEHELLHSTDILPEVDGGIMQQESKNTDPPTLVKKVAEQSDEKGGDVCVDIEEHRKKEQVA